MTPKQKKTFVEYVNEYESMSAKDKTDYYNLLNVNERLAFIDYISKKSVKEKNSFIKTIRVQAVKDFWTHEKELIKQGLSTRDWTR